MDTLKIDHPLYMRLAKSMLSKYIRLKEKIAPEEIKRKSSFTEEEEETIWEYGIEAIASIEGREQNKEKWKVGRLSIWTGVLQRLEEGRKEKKVKDAFIKMISKDDRKYREEEEM